MIALFDMGNSRIKWAWFDQGLNQDPPCLKDAGSASYLECAIKDIGRLNWSAWPQPEQIIVSSVGSEGHGQQLQDWCAQHWQLKPLRVVSADSQCGVSNAYSIADELGSDRWAALLGAHHLFHEDNCIIDCGSAMTVDFLAGSGQHLGGYIIPGLAMMQQSLVQGTDAISSAHAEDGVEGSLDAGHSTAECIERGVSMAATGLIEKSIKNMQSRTGTSFRSLITGGNAKTLLAHCDEPMLHEPKLVLMGLAQIAINERKLTLTRQRKLNT